MATERKCATCSMEEWCPGADDGEDACGHWQEHERSALQRVRAERDALKAEIASHERTIAKYQDSDLANSEQLKAAWAERDAETTLRKKAEAEVDALKAAIDRLRWSLAETEAVNLNNEGQVERLTQERDAWAKVGQEHGASTPGVLAAVVLGTTHAAADLRAQLDRVTDEAKRLKAQIHADRESDSQGGV